MRTCLLLICYMTAICAADDWEVAAQQRIERIRMGDVHLHLLDKKGQPAVGAQVVLEQQAHHFAFGTAVNARTLVEAGSDDHPYRQHLVELFNCTVLENGLKWNQWEILSRRQLAMEALRWMRAKGFDQRGHTLVWQTKQFGSPMPKDVWPEVLKAETGEAADLDHVRRRIDERIDNTVAQLRGMVSAWDVTNELTAHQHAIKVLDPEHPPRQSPLIADWYRRAHAIDPSAKLFLNDYHIFVNRNENHRKGYEETIEYLLAEGAPLHAIGMQCHLWRSDLCLTVDELNAVMDRFGRFNLPMWITEFDTYGSGWGAGQEAHLAQAEALRQYMICAFAHPGVEGFVLWGFWDGAHHAKSAPLFRADWSPKPGLAVYKELLFDRWWSREQGTSNDAGQLDLRVYKGRHLLRITHDDSEHTVEINLTGDALTETVYLR